MLYNEAPGGQESVPCLASLYVVPHRRGEGIGTQLCRAILREARRMGLTRVGTFTPDRQPFYLRQGWTERGTVTDFVGDQLKSIAYLEIQLASG
jgi:predicted N-acetyltransferase YhbS